MLTFLSGQNETVGHIYKVVTEMRNQNFIVIKDESVMSLRDWTCDK